MMCVVSSFIRKRTWWVQGEGWSGIRAIRAVARMRVRLGLGSELGRVRVKFTVVVEGCS